MTDAKAQKCEHRYIGKDAGAACPDCQPVAAQGNPVALTFQRIDDQELQELVASLKLRDGTLSAEEFMFYLVARRAENDTQGKLIEALTHDVAQRRAEIARLQSQLAAAEADARRYRWIRVWASQKKPLHLEEPTSPENCDQIIDAAIDASLPAPPT